MIYLEHILQATNGALIHRGKQHRFDTFCHDTRQLIPGEMFVAVRGEQGDGHDYLLDAVGRGAAGLLLEARVMSSLSEETRTALERSGAAAVRVADTRIALQYYGRYILRRWHPTVIAVTGNTCRSFFFSSRRRHTRSDRDWSSDVCSSDLGDQLLIRGPTFSRSVRLMSLGKRIPEVVGLATVLICAGGCDTLNIKNPNAPDSPDRKSVV